MRFFSNKIPVSTSKKSFADLIKEATAKTQTVKTAAAAAPAVKEANIGNFGDKKAKPFGGKEEDTKEEKDCNPKEEDCAKEAAAEEVIVTAEAEENYEEERRTDVHHVEGTKDQQSGKGNGEPEDNGAVNTGESKKEAKAKPAKVAAEVPAQNEDNKKRTDVHHQENTKDQESKGTNGEPEDKAAAVVVPDYIKVASAILHGSKGWKKFANLSSKQKEFMRRFFSMYYPKEYVDALIADK